MTEIPDILREIVAQRRARLDEIPPAEVEALANSVGGDDRRPRENGFLQSLGSANGHAIIAEIKLASPRLGRFKSLVDPENQARLYAQGGAAAISVVVEPDFFHGSYDLLARCRQASALPTLAKDFIVHPLQLEWARLAGADAVLLIAAIVSREDLMELADRARGLGLVPLIECHSEADFDRLAGGDWEVVGINNRNLETFAVDLNHSLGLLRRVPAGALKIAESGIKTETEIAVLEAAGFDAFLVGESLLLADDPSAKLVELVGKRGR